MEQLVIMGFITAFFIVFISTPSLIKVAKLKHLVDEPGEARKLHKRSIPTLGGIIIFAATIFSFSLWFPTESKSIVKDISDYKHIISSLLILFFIGVKDDIIGTAPMKKLIGHIVVSFILVMMADIRIEQMHGIFGVSSMPYWASIMLSVFVYIVIVNGFNLIDGVDGLATGIGIIASLSFGVWFYLVNDTAMALLSFVLGGALCGFMIFNFSPARIFMGDSGSLIIGAIISILAIRMIESSLSSGSLYLSEISKPVLAMSILAYPLTDTIRVFTQRAAKGQSPFKADRNHTHHKLLDLGLSHRKAIGIIFLFNLIIIGIALLCQKLPPTLALLICATTSIVLAIIPSLLLKHKKTSY
jgi:UDP-GlcNAc:undecaprenyl-phosphate/decaprenyl-phosphate GlcNAc-1-phosphate transferase